MPPVGLVNAAIIGARRGDGIPAAAAALQDKAVRGPWTNPAWLNAIASLIVGVLVVLSAILTATTLFPHVSVRR